MYTFDDLLAPIDRAAFIRDYLGKAFMHSSGDAQRWDTMLSWPEIAIALGRMRARSRLRMVRSGQPLAESTFLDMNEKSEAYDGTVKLAAVDALLDSGTTLVINHAEELFPAVHEMWTSLRSVFYAPIDAGVFIARCDISGLTAHWDGIDGFIVQVAGKKRWRLHKPDDKWPVVAMRKNARSPTRPPDWDGVLNPGDVLYLPRGWWHAPEPLGELSIHVTFGVYTPTGIDILRWLADQAISATQCREPLPLLHDNPEQEHYADRLRSSVSDLISTDIVRQYQLWRQSRMTLRRPEDVINRSASTCTQADNDRLLLIDRYRLFIVRLEDGDVEFEAAGSKWRCAAPLVPALTLLNDTNPVSMEAMQHTIDTEWHIGLRHLVSTLVKFGAVRSV